MTIAYYDGFEENGWFLDFPVAQATALFVIDTDVEKSITNRIVRGANATFVGNPVFSGSTPPDLTGLATYLQTQETEAAEESFFAVIKTAATGLSAAERPMFFGTYSSPALVGVGGTFGLSLATNAAATLSGFATRGTTVEDDASYPASISDWDQAHSASDGWHLVCMRVNATTTLVEDLTTGETDLRTQATPRFLSSGKYRIGGGFDTLYQGVSKVALWSHVRRRIGDTERDRAAEWIRAREARHGRVV